MGLPIIWQPNAGGSTYPTKTRLKGGITPSGIDIDSIQNYTALNQILAEMNRQAVNAGLAPVPYVVIGHTKVNKALIDTWRATIKAIHGRTFAAASYITRTLIRNLRIALRVNTVQQDMNTPLIFNNAYQVTRTFDSSFVFLSDATLVADRINNKFLKIGFLDLFGNTTISRMFQPFVFPTNADLITDFGSGSIVGYGVNIPTLFFSDIPTEIINFYLIPGSYSTPFTWDLIETDGTFLFQSQLGLNNNDFFTSTSLPPGDYVIAAAIENDIDLLSSSISDLQNIFYDSTGTNLTQFIFEVYIVYQPDF